MKSNTNSYKYRELLKWYRKPVNFPIKKLFNDQISRIKEHAVGNNVLYIEAWDNSNNGSLYDFLLDVQDSNNKINNVYNIPNPFKDRTFFTFQINEYPLENIKTTIRIFTLNGELIKTINSINKSQFVSILWDSKDNKSHTIPNGSYIYTMEVKYKEVSYNKVGKLSKIK